jgi:hypothetical protein
MLGNVQPGMHKLATCHSPATASTVRGPYGQAGWITKGTNFFVEAVPNIVFCLACTAEYVAVHLLYFHCYFQQFHSTGKLKVALHLLEDPEPFPLFFVHAPVLELIPQSDVSKVHNKICDRTGCRPVQT